MTRNGWMDGRIVAAFIIYTELGSALEINLNENVNHTRVFSSTCISPYWLKGIYKIA